MEGANIIFEKRLKELENKLLLNSTLLEVTSKANSVLSDEVKRLQKSLTLYCQYTKNRQLEHHRVSNNFDNNELPIKVSSFFSLTGQYVTPNDLEKCHYLKTSGKVIVEFSSRKERDSVLYSQKALKGKDDEKRNIGISPVNLAFNLEVIAPEFILVDS